jgi:hypothetical protein
MPSVIKLSVAKPNDVGAGPRSFNAKHFWIILFV